MGMAYIRKSQVFPFFPLEFNLTGYGLREMRNSNLRWNGFFQKGRKTFGSRNGERKEAF